MDFSDVRRELVALGWQCNGETTISPSKSFWFDRQTFALSPMRVYAPAARRVYSASTVPSVHQELRGLLALLERQTEIAVVAKHVRDIGEVAARWAVPHGATLSSWDFGYPAVRATARHPDGGVAAIECLAEAAPGIETIAYHWVDDWRSKVRRGWEVRLRANSVDELTETLDQAVHALLEPRPSMQYTTSELDDDGSLATADDAYWAAFQVLR